MSGKTIFFICLSMTLISKSLNKNVSGLNGGRSDSDGKGSLVFVFDTTGSMYNDLEQLRDGAERILNTALEDSNVIADFVFMPFHDPVVGPATVTRDKAVFKSALGKVNVYGGGDCPEKSLGGIKLALSVSQPRSFIYVFTDATAGDHRLVGKILDTIQRKQSQVVFVLTGHCNDLDRPSYQVYHQIARASSGQVFNLNKTSVHKVLDFVRSSIKDRSINLASAINPPGYNYTKEIPIDKSVSEVTVSVSGSKPQIHVVNPSGDVLTGPPQLVTTLDLAEIMIVKVLNPEPGNWSITVGSEEEHSVKVVGLSNLTFEHGFSVQPPATMDETSYRPLQGTYNNMLISVSGADRLKLNYAEILRLNGETLFEVALKNAGGGYRADPFLPPDELFYIAINGEDEHGQKFRRVGSTAVQGKPPDVPFLEAPAKVKAHPHERVVIPCHADSLVPVSVSWGRSGERPQRRVNTLQSTTLELVIDAMSEADVDTYVCVAKNAAGVATTSTLLELIVDPPQVTISGTDIVMEQQELIVSCSVYSEALLKYAQLDFRGEQQRYVEEYQLEPSLDGVYEFNKTIKHAGEQDSGVYECVAANRGGATNQSIRIAVNSKPTAQILGPHSLYKSKTSDVQVVCRAENAELVTWLVGGVVVKSEPVEGSYNSMLDIRNITEDGVWTCVASKDSVNASDAVEITVLIKPQVSIEGPKNITVLNGTSVEIICTIVAKPAPRILWHMETERFLEHTVTLLKPDVYKSVLSLNSSMENIQATYFCVGENIEGIAEDNINVNVRRKMTVVMGFADMSVELYSNAHLPCVINAYPQPNITWYHNDTVLEFDDNVNLAEDGRSIVIEKVDFDELGVYQCVGDNGFENVTIAGRLEVHGLEAPVISKTQANKTVRSGDAVDITCRVAKGKPEPIVTWLHKNGTDFTNIQGGEKNRLRIDSVNAENSGTYRCVAENIIGRDVYDIELKVQYPPRENISEPLHLEGPRLVAVGGKIVLSCSYSGNPSPLVVWTKDDAPIAYSDHMYLTGTDLVIEEASEYESGVFTCMASNPLGSERKNYTVQVYKAPIITVTGEPEIQVLEGQLVELPCSANGVPQPAITWLQNGEPVKRRKHIDEYGMRFVANLTDFGEYSCIASNEFGNTMLNYTVLVWVPPFIKGIPEDYLNVQLGTNVSLSCDAVGFPVPDISWEVNGYRLTETTTDMIFDNLGNFHVSNISIIQEGVYSCIAENIAGVAVKTFHVVVNERPALIADNFTESYIGTEADTELTLTCRASGRPRPYVYWIKDGYYLQNDARYEVDFYGTLTIKKPTEDMSGTYTCLAKNALGNVTRDVPVQIYAAPKQMQSEESPVVVKVVEGSELDVRCPLGRDSDNITWYKNAEFTSTGSLSIHNVSRAHASEYACAVRNVAGSAHAIITLDVQWPPTFLADAHDVQVMTGDDVYFDCRTDAKPPARTKWLFNSKPLLGEDKARLKLLNIKLINGGTYKCIARNEHGTIYREYHLTVLEPPRISQFNELDVQLKAGVDAMLECNAKGTPNPIISWKFNNSQWRVEDSKLVVTNVSHSSEGSFRCEATNPCGTAHAVYHVSVVSGALITELLLFVDGQPRDINSTIDLVPGTNARIACKATGIPPPTIQWIHHGTTLSKNARGIGYADLILNNVSSTQAGEYHCVATNEVGTDQRNIQVNVLEAPKIYQTLFLNTNTSDTTIDLSVLSGHTFYMHCHPLGTPAPQVYWFKDGLPLHLYDDTMVSSDFGEVIVSNSATLEQSGNYTCVARNVVGQTSVAYLVDVLVPPPKQKEDVKPVRTLAGKLLNLTCPVEGAPPPYVTWTKAYTEITDTDRIKLLNDNYTLMINQTEVTDSGKYSCIMTNKVGTTEVVFSVTIEQAPVIAGNTGDNITESHVVALGRSAILKCEVDGNPTPVIRWLKDMQPVGPHVGSVEQVAGGSVLAVWTAGVEHAGLVACLAENSAGLTQRLYRLQVKVPGKWGSWSAWSYCNVTCGRGHQERSRSCQYIDDNNSTYDSTNHPDMIIVDETSCKGSKQGKRICTMPACDSEESASGVWSGWSRWSACSASCGAGSQTRARRCRRPPCAPTDNVQIRKCPGLPKCERSVPTNEVYNEDSTEDVEQPDYLPEAVFEVPPDGDEAVVVPDSAENYEYYEPSTVSSHSVSQYYDVNVTDNLDRSDQGPCKPGYRHNTIENTCDDIDECTIENNQCHGTQLCANTAGGYRCGCAGGYTALGAGQRCLDINECSIGNSGCEYACVNTAGGFVCACPAGLRLHTDRRRCVSPSAYRSNSLEAIEDGRYLSTSMEYPTRYTKHTRN